MRIVRNCVLKEDKKIPIAIIIIAVFMLIISVIDFTLFFNQGSVALNISSVGTLSSVLSLIPISWGVCVALLLKTKKNVFAKMPAYIISAMIAIAFIIYYIIFGQKNPALNILLLSVVVLTIYPFIISALTIEGRLYNRVFATIFSVLLIVLCTAGAVVYCILMNAIILSTLLPALMYTELMLIVFCFNLEKPMKKTEKSNTITH